VLSLLANRDMDSFVPGIKDILEGGYPTKNGTALSFVEKHKRGLDARQALADYQTAIQKNDTAAAKISKQTLKENYAQFGYSYIDKPEKLIPHIPTVYYSFRIMVMLGFYFILLFAVLLWKQKSIEKQKWLLWISLWSIPLGYVASQLGWVVAEVGRQPWAIQDVLPLNAAISHISTGSVMITFFLFLSLFSALLVAEIRIMLKQIKKGPTES
jgi:cytochrome d ubiquinol oxidase subunit I